jgi:hypothetical protein
LESSRSENEMLKRKDAAPVQHEQLSALLSARDSKVAYLRKKLRESSSHLEAEDDALTCIQELQDQAWFSEMDRKQLEYRLYAQEHALDRANKEIGEIHKNLRVQTNYPGKVRPLEAVQLGGKQQVEKHSGGGTGAMQ